MDAAPGFLWLGEENKAEADPCGMTTRKAKTKTTATAKQGQQQQHRRMRGSLLRSE
jgi:hypothetical protein